MIEDPELTCSLVRERLERDLPSETLAHASRCADLARLLASAHGVDPDRAELAALLHDIADAYSDVELLILAERYDIRVSLTEARVPRLLHGKVAAEILRREWGITDEELLDAVGEHTTGGVRMSPLAKVTFIADKLEQKRDRHNGGPDPIREMAMIDLDQAVLKLYAWRINELVRAGRPIDDSLVAARNRLIENTLATQR
jgi:predicted HD superfamily hydrolase involved in NAD metabolism